jgi:hypothetical protein
MPRKYVVQFVDEIGIPYVRTICANGKLGKALTCIALQGDYAHYEHDPDIADHFLLDGEGDYNPIQGLKELKKRKMKIRKINKKIAVDCEDYKEFNDIIKQGEDFWMVPNPQTNELKTYKYRYVAIIKKPGSWGGFDTMVQVVDYKGRVEDLSTWHFQSRYNNIYLEQPMCELTGIVDED